MAAVQASHTAMLARAVDQSAVSKLAENLDAFTSALDR